MGDFKSFAYTNFATRADSVTEDRRKRVLNVNVARNGRVASKLPSTGFTPKALEL